jgi:hypothetical protein
MPRILKIEPDHNPLNPREENDNLGTMVCFHRRYDLGDKHNFRDPDDFVDFLKCNPSFCLPLYLYDHSGITISTSPFSCPWDSGQLGWIYVTKEAIRKEWGKKRVSSQLSKIVIKNLEAEVMEYDQYLTGDIYGFNLIDEVLDEDGDLFEEIDVDSCWGFFGSDPNTNGMSEYVDMAKVDEIRTPW